MGALAALATAARHPDRVAGLCLLGAAARMPVHPDLLALAAAHDPKAVELICDWAFGPRGQVGGNPQPGGWLQGTARALLQRGNPAVLSTDLAACNAYAAGLEHAAQVRCPTLVVIGALDRMTPPKAGAGAGGGDPRRARGHHRRGRPHGDGRGARCGARGHHQHDAAGHGLTARPVPLTLQRTNTVERPMTQIRTLGRVALLALVMLWLPAAAHAEEVWQTLPPTPTRPPALAEGKAPVDGIEIYYAEYGAGQPVILLHGGLANSDYWGNQIPALAPHYRVIVMDSRGHGRSTRDAQPYGYDLMAKDVVGLMDFLKIEKADIVGWSDGAIIGLDLAMNYPGRIDRVFAFAANSTTAGLKPDIDKNPTFAAFITRAGEEYKKNSPTPDQYDAFLAQIGGMWASQPNWTAEQLGRIRTPVMIADGDHDEAIRRDHTEQLAKEVPGAQLLILPNVSHFAMLQNPAEFNAAVLKFLAE